MLSVQIANKLSNLYCNKADSSLDEYVIKYYGIECDINEFNIENELKLTVLEYFSNFKEQELLSHSKIDCLKKLLNG